jgi:hypothetical protein
VDLPDHIPYGEGKNNMINNLKSLKDEYLLKGGEDVDFVNKVNNLENFLLYNKKLPKADNKRLGPGANQQAHSEI